MVEHRQTEPEHADHPVDQFQPAGLLYIGDVQALRLADTVTFHTGVDGGAHIDAQLSGTVGAVPRVYTARQQRLFPDTDRSDRLRRVEVSAEVAGFDAARRWHERHLPGAAGFVRVECAALDEVWRSIAAFVRVGDVIGLRWRADSPVDALFEPSLHRDELRLAVQRGAHQWTFLLDVQVRAYPLRMITCGWE